MHLYDKLKELGLDYVRVDHPPVYTCAEANKHVPHLPGIRTKNLFARDAKGRRHFLVVVPDEAAVDLNELGRSLGAGRLSMGSPDRLMEYLGVEPGAVSILSLVNDPERRVEVVIDRSVWEAEILQCHPLVNTSTLAIAKAHLVTLLGFAEHAPTVLDVPLRPPALPPDPES